MIQNPTANELPTKVLEGYLREAVRRSGYPLQTVVASELQKSFSVTEEWGYQDRTTQEHRTLDIFAYRKLPEENRAGLLIAPALVLLVECKRSQNPYVFFKSETECGRPLMDFPRIAGLQRIELHEGQKSQEISPSRCLGLESEHFVIECPPVCTSFARAGGKSEDGHGNAAARTVQDGRGMVLTGTDGYNSILLPLISSLEFLGNYYSVSVSPVYPTIAFAVCILDGPMVLSEGSPELPILSMVPWVRLLRREKRKIHNGFLHAQFVVDFVHRHALAPFLGELLQFASLVRDRAVEKGAIFQSGHAAVNDLNGWLWSDIRPR
jgi:hypothetical protein